MAEQVAVADVDLIKGACMRTVNAAFVRCPLERICCLSWWNRQINCVFYRFISHCSTINDEVWLV